MTVLADRRRRPRVTRPPAEGAGVHLPQPAGALPDGYVLEELLVEGVATSYEPVSTPRDGAWVVRPGSEAPFRTRVVVRRPTDPRAFSGTVLVEWFNVSAVEAAPDWGYLSDAIARDGHAHVGVSAQALGVEGGTAVLGLDADADGTRDPGGTQGLKQLDPARYGTLEHPGDAHAFDIFTQVGREVLAGADTLLGGAVAQRVIAIGESQSAMFLSTLLNAVHPLDPVFDGALVHSRGALVAAVDGTYTPSRWGGRPTGTPGRGVRIRTDLDVPVMVVEAETDLTELGYVHARQPDTDRIRTWEVAGTAHADSETLRAVIGGPRDPLVGELIGCGSVNAGPQKEVLRAALHHLVTWVEGGDAPPRATPLEVDVAPGSAAVLRRDRWGNALGGVRTPLVDVPVATLSGDPPDDPGHAAVGGICELFGRTIPFDPATLVALHGDAATYLDRFRRSLDEAVAAGFVLRPDADALLVDIEPNLSRFG